MSGYLKWESQRLKWNSINEMQSAMLVAIISLLFQPFVSATFIDC